MPTISKSELLVLSDRYILTGWYDGFGRIWRAAGICKHLLDGHSGLVTSVCILKPKVGMRPSILGRSMRNIVGRLSTVLISEVKVLPLSQLVVPTILFEYGILACQRPLAVIDTHKDKVLCADWWKHDSMISGGVDSKLCISSGISVQWSIGLQEFSLLHGWLLASTTSPDDN
ncbi:hypothetical protein Pfo_008886 [Paulownia fortunei]|nr:hypothetical protein Pfo_008886 [Paulownia fortunei]